MQKKLYMQNLIHYFQHYMKKTVFRERKPGKFEKHFH